MPQKIEEKRKALQNLIDFVLYNVEDEGSFEVQRRLNQIEVLFWECFDHYKD